MRRIKRSHIDKNNDLIRRLNISDMDNLVWDKDEGLVYWNEGKLLYESGLTKTKIIVMESKSLYNEIKSLDLTSQLTCRRLISDIKNGYYYIDSPGNEKDFTNYMPLANIKLNIKSTLSYYKRINNEDRLIYDISYPYPDRKLKLLIIPINIKSCIGHEYRQYPSGPRLFYFSDKDVKLSINIDKSKTYIFKRKHM